MPNVFYPPLLIRSFYLVYFVCSPFFSFCFLPVVFTCSNYLLYIFALFVCLFF